MTELGCFLSVASSHCGGAPPLRFTSTRSGKRETMVPGCLLAHTLPRRRLSQRAIKANPISSERTFLLADSAARDCAPGELEATRLIGRKSSLVLLHFNVALVAAYSNWMVMKHACSKMCVQNCLLLPFFFSFSFYSACYKLNHTYQSLLKCGQSRCCSIWVRAFSCNNNFSGTRATRCCLIEAHYVVVLFFLFFTT